MLWETPPLINNSVMAHDSVPLGTRESLLRALLELGATTEGRAILARMHTSGFSRAANADYESVRHYVTRFEKEVRPVEQP